MHIRTFTAADIPAGMRLKQLAGWNQVEADWRRLLTLEPAGCFLAEDSGQVVGTVATTLLGGVAWISMMLVEPQSRGQGIGRALMQHALDTIDRRGVPTVRLDATPMGRPLYETLGFVDQFVLDRHAGVVRPLPASHALQGTVESYRPGQHAELLAIDARGTHTDRATMLEHMLAEFSDRFLALYAGGRMQGYALSRPGSQATLVGPCVSDPAWAAELLTAALARLEGEMVYVDVPREHAAAADVCGAAGLVPQRPLYRMCRGPNVRERTGWLVASSGPEKG